MEPQTPMMPTATPPKPKIDKIVTNKLPKRKPKNAFFSLLELLLAVSIILILTAILLPRLIQSRAAALESSGAGAVHSLNTALTAYQNEWGTFPATASMLGGNCIGGATAPTAALSCQLDNVMANEIGTTPIGAYTFTYVQTNSGNGYTINADPAPGVSSGVVKHFYSDESAQIHVNTTTTAGPNDPTL